MGLKLEKTDGVLMGVCASFARRADVDATLARVTAALVALFLAPVAIPAYLLAGLAINYGHRHAEARDRLLS
jgi:phage shock protein PspC (stress-responsive transcriptional regulator)